MNKDIEKFFKKNNINASDISNNPNSYIATPNDINSIIAQYGILLPTEKATVNVGDILGYDRLWREIPGDIIASLDHFFDSNGSTYHSRSVGLLDYSSDEIIEKLMSSFVVDPMYVDEADLGKYCISTNGLHRYSLLRIHYLNELIKAGDDSAEIERIKAKYEIPVYFKKLDYTKTYCKFLLDSSNMIRGMESELDSNYKQTGKVVIKDFSNNIFVLDNAQLLEFTQAKISGMADNQFYCSYIDGYVTKYKSFSNFINDNFQELTTDSKKDISVGGAGA